MPRESSWTCRRFLARGITPAPIFISPKDHVALVGALLASKDIHCAILGNPRNVIGSIYGYQLVSFVLESRPNELYRCLWHRVEEVQEIGLPSPLPQISLDDSCLHALGEIAASRFGDLLILGEEHTPVGLLTLLEMLKLLAGQTKALGLKLKEIASPLRLLKEDEKLIGVFQFMMRNRIRRVVIKRSGSFHCCTEREILKIIFSLNGLESLRDDPKRFLQQPIGEFLRDSLIDVPSFQGGIDVARAWVHAVENPLGMLIVDRDKIATPWDFVVKPFLEGKIPF